MKILNRRTANLFATQIRCFGRPPKHDYPGAKSATTPPKVKEQKMFSPAHLANELALKERTSKLQKVIANEIRVAGFAPMSLARFMELALMHPQYGYYSTKD